MRRRWPLSKAELPAPQFATVHVGYPEHCSFFSPPRPAICEEMAHLPRSTLPRQVFRKNTGITGRSLDNNPSWKIDSTVCRAVVSSSETATL